MITLQPYKGPSTRYQCPQCRDRQKTFTRYIDTETGQQLADHVGKCARLIKCGYHYTPKQYFAERVATKALSHKARPSFSRLGAFVAKKTATGGTQSGLINTAPSVHPISYITSPAFELSLQTHTPLREFAASNNFVAYLLSRFGPQATREAVDRYLIGTSDHRFTSKEYPGYTSPPGATIFWQGDEQGRVRTGKIMLYDAVTGKRVKQPFNHITWAHTLLNDPHYHLEQCLFGAHLLPLWGGKKPVAIVESEKTAIIASIYRPEYTWLATGSLSNLTAQKCQPLKGRRVILYPDLGCYELWRKKALELCPITQFEVSDMLEKIANAHEKQEGYDLADFLLGG